TTTQLLAQDFTQALNDPSIKAILLNIDSPGGEAKGIHELAEMIYQARGKKRIIAYDGGNACSAAYWIASACDEIVIDATGCAGSIGTVL
ncbi:S49 family peptidase, partial [Vibrio parahaemolyticus]|uniref:S49 family peptidase n=1 Tax=Vibrio parahaemolyticus TaxID=670 RepID=UPI001A8E9543